MNRILLLLTVLVLIYIPVYTSREWTINLTREDGFYEWSGALLFLGTSILFAKLYIRKSLSPLIKGIYGLNNRVYFLLFALLFFFAFGEEISWGQRIFDFDTPDSMLETNRQRELNIHNVGIFHGRDATGEYKRGIAALFTMHALFYGTFLLYLLVFPIAYRFSRVIRKIVDNMAIPVPHWILGVLFLFNWIYGNVLRSFRPDFDYHGIVEIKETGMGIILLFLPLYFMGYKLLNEDRNQ